MCVQAIRVKNSGDQPVPCGRCSECRARRVSAWSFRLMQQEKISISANFITLTYDTSHVPLTDSGFMSLSVRDLQLFFKRLRKAHGKAYTLKYYAAGEYGGKTNRPHYHVILFNANIELIQNAWNLGSVHYGSVSGASVGYTLKYISKQSKIPQHAKDDRKKEFSIMSKGIGENYLNPSMVLWHKNDLENRMYINIGDGKKASMPRYYKDKLYSETERKKIAEKAAGKAADAALAQFVRSNGHPYVMKKELLEIEKKFIILPKNDSL